MNYNKAIKLARVLSGKGQLDVASLVGIDKSLLSRIERGEREVSMDLFDRISEGLEIPRDVMFLLAAEQEDLKSISEKRIKDIGKVLVKMLTTEYE